MLSQKLVEFLHGPRGMYIGTRDSELRPAIAMAVGCVADAEAGTISVFLPDIENGQTLKNLKDNGMVAMTVLDARNEAFQFKGRFIEARPGNARDRAVQNIYREKNLAQMADAPHIDGPTLVNGFVLDPSTTVTFEVEEVFAQTPGPGAGAKIDPSSEASG